MLTPSLSVLDLVPVRQGQTSSQAIAASLDVARLADQLGFTRYWFAEHHNTASVASTAPPVLVAAAAMVTSHIRVGSGGVMLPNHAPLIVAEQFAALEALAPGRVDLGIGRAPGSDPVITQLLRSAGTTSAVDAFAENVDQILALVQPDGATLRFTTGREYQVRATPAAVGVPKVWLLGSSDFSARLAAERGLPYVFANHFAGEGLEAAMTLYRRGYQPSAAYPEPRSFVTANVSVAETAAEAAALALPQLRTFARMRSGLPFGLQETVEQAQTEPLPEAAQNLIPQIASRWIIGDPESAAQQLRALAEVAGVDEVMIAPVAGARDADPLGSAVGRLRTLELLASAMNS